MTKKKEQKEDSIENTQSNEITPDNVQEGEIIETEISPEPVLQENEIDKSIALELRIIELESALAQLNDKYLRLSAEYDNYRKRTLREKMELARTASESVMRNLLTVVDDFERAMKSIEQGMDLEATKEGILLINNKFKDFAKQNGIKEIEAEGQVFNTDLHEAITKIPAPSDELKGKILDVIQKGYILNDKVIRFAKVVVGE